MGLHSSIGLLEHCSANGEGSNAVEDPKRFFRVYLQLLKLQLPLRRSYLHLKICISAVHIIFMIEVFLGCQKRIIDVYI